MQKPTLRRRDDQLVGLLLDAVTKSTRQLATVSKSLGELKLFCEEKINQARESTDERCQSVKSDVDRILIEIMEITKTVGLLDARISALTNEIDSCQQLQPGKWWQSPIWILCACLLLLIVIIGGLLKIDLPLVLKTLTGK